jgi:hypothetical protein
MQYPGTPRCMAARNLATWQGTLPWATLGALRAYVA